MEPLSQVTFQFDLAVPAGESSEFVGGKKKQPIKRSGAYIYLPQRATSAAARRDLFMVMYVR